MQRRDLAVWALGTASLSIKHVTLFLVLTLFVYAFGPRRAVLLMVGSLAIFGLSFAPYIRDGYQRIIDRVILYRSWDRYGFNSPLLFWLVMPWTPFIARRLRLDLPDALLFSTLCLFTFAYGVGADLFALLFAVAFIRPTAWLVPLTAVVLLLINPWHGLEMNQPFNTNNAAWLVVAPWLVHFTYNRYKRLRAL